MTVSHAMDFPAAEYEARLERARKLMEERGLDALLVSEPSNYRYFVGYDQPFGAAWNGYILTRPFLCLVPRSGRPTLLVHLSFENATRHSTWIQDVRTWSSLPFRAEYLVDLLRDAGLDGGAVVGVELGEDQRLGFPVQAFLDLGRALPSVRFVDCADILWRLRIRKSPAEIECIRNACLIMHEAYEKTFRQAGIGFTEKDVDLHLRRN
ncbi:MAG: aminopeptidase P family N-terminal domain-containing protein, partial [Firmicutes bacterium]|nr:aminopeptidase P family N-terminal domain-containing protein [Bacillota bacterium]